MSTKLCTPVNNSIYLHCLFWDSSHYKTSCYQVVIVQWLAWLFTLVEVPGSNPVKGDIVESTPIHYTHIQYFLLTRSGVKNWGWILSKFCSMFLASTSPKLGLPYLDIFIIFTHSSYHLVSVNVRVYLWAQSLNVHRWVQMNFEKHLHSESPGIENLRLYL